jgi:hypothetical protein
MVFYLRGAAYAFFLVFNRNQERVAIPSNH